MHVQLITWYAPDSRVGCGTRPHTMSAVLQSVVYKRLEELLELLSKSGSRNPLLAYK